MCVLNIWGIRGMIRIKCVICCINIGVNIFMVNIKVFGKNFFDLIINLL